MLLVAEFVKIQLVLGPVRVVERRQRPGLQWIIEGEQMVEMESLQETPYWLLSYLMVLVLQML